MAQAPTLSVSESCERTVMRAPGVSEIVLPAPVPLTAPDTLIVTPVAFFLVESVRDAASFRRRQEAPAPAA